MTQTSVCVRACVLLPYLYHTLVLNEQLKVSLKQIPSVSLHSVWN